jgi:AraC family ethanolamine operon transcriptional activator
MKSIDVRFDDIDEMAQSAIDWDQHYEQIGRGRFSGQLSQLVLSQLQLGRERWSLGVLQRGTAPPGTWVFGLPLATEGTLHIRRRPVQAGELLAATSRDDIGFTATGATDMMVVVLPTKLITQWMQQRRGMARLDPNLPPRHWTVSAPEMASRALALAGLLSELRAQSDDPAMEAGLPWIEAKISDVILDMIPSAETIEPLHNRARIARAVLQLLESRRDDPPTLTEMCAAVDARERTLFLSCVEAFGRPPKQLLLELRLNAVQRALTRPGKGISVTGTAARYGFSHFGRFAAMYARQFGENPSATLATAAA